MIIQPTTIIYPSYIDAKKTKRQGRRLGRAFCVDSPILEEIKKACEILKIECEIESGKAYPKSWWEKGRAVVKSDGRKKLSLLKDIAKEVKKLRK